MGCLSVTVALALDKSNLAPNSVQCDPRFSHVGRQMHFPTAIPDQEPVSPLKSGSYLARRNPMVWLE